MEVGLEDELHVGRVGGNDGTASPEAVHHDRLCWRLGQELGVPV